MGEKTKVQTTGYTDKHEEQIKLCQEKKILNSSEQEHLEGWNKDELVPELYEKGERLLMHMYVCQCERVMSQSNPSFSKERNGKFFSYMISNQHGSVWFNKQKTEGWEIRNSVKTCCGPFVILEFAQMHHLPFTTRRQCQSDQWSLLSTRVLLIHSANNHYIPLFLRP